MRFGHIVVGPAGHGKTTYCKAMVKHGEAIGRQINVVNLDPAADNVAKDGLIVDVRTFVTVDEVMEDVDLNLGPNGGLVFAMEQLLDDTEWLREQLGEYDDDYILFDCPGQIELHTHFNVIKKLVDLLQSMNFRLCGVFLLDSGFFLDASKFFSAVLVTLSTMVNLEIPFFNILSKTDLLGRDSRRILQEYLDPDTNFMLVEEGHWNTAWSEKFKKLTLALSAVIEDYSLVKFVPMNIFKEDSLNDILVSIDGALQYDEDREIKMNDFDPDNEEPRNADDVQNIDGYT